MSSVFLMFHAAQVARLDTETGKLLDSLRELGIDRNTLVIFIGDMTRPEGGVENPEPARQEPPVAAKRHSALSCWLDFQLFAGPCTVNPVRMRKIRAGLFQWPS